MAEHDIITYRIYLSNQELSFAGKKVNTAAQIVCYEDARGRSGDRVVVFVFGEPGGLRPDYRTKKGLFRAFVPWNQYTWYVDFLRNEGPHKIKIDDKTLQWFFRTRDPEKAGEWDF